MTKGHIFAICGPSGAGKGTLINRLLKEYPDFAVPSSYTTRPPRPEEGTYKRYNFVTETEFMQQVEQGNILEFERTHGFLYGTNTSSITEALGSHATIIAEVDPRGALTYKNYFGKDKVTIIFIALPNVTSLRSRFKNDPRRKNITKSEIERRIKTMEEENKLQSKADHIIVNEDNKLEETYQKLVAIIENK